jgi:hypothetical protein
MLREQKQTTLYYESAYVAMVSFTAFGNITNVPHRRRTVLRATARRAPDRHRRKLNGRALHCE